MSLQDKVVVLTGATGGLGSVIAHRLYREGCKLVLPYREERKINELREALLGEEQRILSLRADVTNEQDVVRIFEKALEKFSSVSILCNCVGGYMDSKPFTDLTLNEWNSMILQNLTSCFLTCREAIRRMRDNEYGRIINFTAMPAMHPEGRRGGYGVAKAGLVYLTKMVGMEIKGTGVTINAIAPSIIRTPANESWGKPEDMQYWVTPDQLADIVLYLCGESARSINGTVIEAYGGV